MRYAILGKTQSGKTHWVYHYIYSRYPGTRIFIDPKPSKYVLPTKPNGLRIPSITKLKKPLDEIILIPHFSYDFVTETRRLFQYIIKQKIKDNSTKRILVVVDEFHRFSTKHKALPELDKLINEGEAHGIDTIMIIQHANRLPDLYILNTEAVAIFGDRKILIDYLVDKIDFPIDSKHKLVKSHLSKDFHGIYWDYGKVSLIVPRSKKE